MVTASPPSTNGVVNRPPSIRPSLTPPTFAPKRDKRVAPSGPCLLDMERSGQVSRSVEKAPRPNPGSTKCPVTRTLVISGSPSNPRSRPHTIIPARDRGAEVPANPAFSSPWNTSPGSLGSLRKSHITVISPLVREEKSRGQIVDGTSATAEIWPSPVGRSPASAVRLVTCMLALGVPPFPNGATRGEKKKIPGRSKRKTHHGVLSGLDSPG